LNGIAKGDQNNYNSGPVYITPVLDAILSSRSWVSGWVVEKPLPNMYTEQSLTLNICPSKRDLFTGSSIDSEKIGGL